MRYVVRGKVLTEIDIDECLLKLYDNLTQDLMLPSLELRVIIDALDKLGQKLLCDKQFVTKHLIAAGMTEKEAWFAKEEASSILNKKAIYLKLKRELSQAPMELTRLSTREPYLEGYMPLGVLGHVTSSNDALLPFLSAVEGLITGNINLIKTGTGASDVAIELAKELCKIEPRLEPYLYIFPISSKETARLSALFACCSAIAVWGSDTAVKGVSSLAPAGVPIIAWGHRISFAYVTKAGKSTDALEGIARDVCVNEQQACSAPQVVYFEAENNDELIEFAKDLFSAMEKISPLYILHDKTDADWAELTTWTELARLSEIMGSGAVFCGPGFRVFADYDETLSTSPLWRTVLVKPMKRCNIIKTLRPYRSYLQSVGLAAATGELAQLSGLFYKAGATRLVSAGKMMSGYTGEPHDGVYALSRYVRRVSLENSNLPETITEFKEICGMSEKPFPDNTPIMRKADFPAMRLSENEGYLLLKSGGSSGKSVYAPHTYGDADMTYVTAGRAMFSAGIKPGDICMNLFYSGSLYGGFISMYEGLKHIDAIQLPMTASMDFDFVAQEIVANNVNVIMGMPTYLLRLLNEQADVLKKYAGIKLVLYGGEHMNPNQIEYLKNEYGVSSVKSLVYGCNEIGSIGYICEYCVGTEHHLFSSKYMEILKMDCDEHVAGSEIGRIILTPVDKENIDIDRYEIGDMGRFVTEPCKCGRLAPKFELLGRFGDVFKFATNYVNYRQIKDILATHLGYTGNLQIVLEYKDMDTMKICVDKHTDISLFFDTLFAKSPEINECITDKTGSVLVLPQQKDAFIISSAGGKIRNVVDLRI